MHFIPFVAWMEQSTSHSIQLKGSLLLVCDLNRTPIVMANHGGPCVHFSGISTCGRTSRETVLHPQHAQLPTLCKISLPVYDIVTNEQLQPLTTTWYNSLVLSFSFLKNLATLNLTSDFSARLVDGSALSFRDGAVDCFTFLLARHLVDVLRYVISEAIRDVKQTRRRFRSTTSSSSNTLLHLIHDKARIEVHLYAIKCHTHAWKLN